MKKSSRRRGVLVIGDAPAFGTAIRALFESDADFSESVRYTTYDHASGILTPRLIQETALFVVELWRTYPTGLRAEGIAVAEQLMRNGAVPLVVSPLSFADQVETAWYWDLASDDDILDRCKAILKGRLRADFGHPAGMEKMRALVAQYLAKPKGHSEIEPRV